MNKLIIFLILNFAFLILNCSDEPTKPKPPVPPVESRDTVTVSVEQVTHRSVSVGVNHRVTLKGSSYVLNRITGQDTFAFVPFALSQSDSLIIDDNNGDGLTLDSDYSYFAYRLDSTGTAKDTSNTTTAKTLAATSHDFTWTEYTIGSGVLYDVWGTDENNVYAVGSVHFGDSTFGVIKWDGSSWKPELFRGGQSTIYGFSESDIWVGGNGGIFHFDGTKWIHLDYVDILDDNLPYTAIWGTSSENLYFTGTQGRIVHWDGSKGTLIQTPTEQTLDDIYGLNNNFILATGSQLAGDGVGLINQGSGWQHIQDLSFISILTKSVFIWNEKNYFIVGSRSFQNLNRTWNEVLTEAPGIVEIIRGNMTTGDLIAAGDGNTLLHFNGIDWHNFSYQLNKPNSALYGVYLTGDYVFTVGAEGLNVEIFIGKR